MLRLGPRSRRPVALLAAAALTLLLSVLAFRWWDRWVEDRLARWAVGEVSRRTGGAYRLALGDLSFLPLAGAIAFDSAAVTTDSAINRRRETPLPVLAWRAEDCRVSGLDVPRLLLRRSFAARELGCRLSVVDLALAPKYEGPAPDPAAPADPLAEVARPLGLSSVRIGWIAFPDLRLRLERPGRRGPASVFLRRARLAAADVVYDPSARLGERGAMPARGARISAEGVVLRPDTLIEIAAARLEADLTDSTLRMAGVRHEPTIPEAEWIRRVRVRRDRISFGLDSLSARGVAWRAFVASGDIAIRALELSGPRIDVLTDRRIPPGPPSGHRTPQQMAAAAAPALRLDTIRVTRGSVVYREREPGTERAGRVGVDAVQATVRHLDAPSRGKPLTISARARLMGEGAVTVEVSVPLDAPDFRYRLSGRVGRMRAAAFNRFLGENEAFMVEDGWIDGASFRQETRNGRAVTVLTPRYRDLSVEATGDGGGLIGKLTRTVKEFVADAFVVRSRNPDEDGKDLRTARTVRRYDPRDGWVRFIWLGLRDAVMEGMRE